ncbi:MAG TPA: hypothetical protein VM008_08785, partial [Phycisphaerae bacterium]|nr:hypothetical protein [Phycisphaerae bacterium]
TGLSAVDYRLTTPHLEPTTATTPAASGGAGPSALPTVETPLPITAPLTCYLPRGEATPLTPVPLLTKTSPAQISFACLAAPAHLNDQTLTLFAQLLHALPQSTLTLLAPEGSYRDRTQEFLTHNNIAPARIFFTLPQPGLAHFQLFHAIDISLDTFPNNAHHIALDSLFMGVPVITLTPPLSDPLPNPLSRTTHSHLTHLGLQDLSTTTPATFIETAKQLAADPQRLTYLRHNLRNRMRASPLMNPSQLARALESAYRHAWHTWCDQHPTPALS